MLINDRRRRDNRCHNRFAQSKQRIVPIRAVAYKLECSYLARLAHTKDKSATARQRDKAPFVSENNIARDVGTNRQSLCVMDKHRSILKYNVVQTTRIMNWRSDSEKRLRDIDLSVRASLKETTIFLTAIGSFLLDTSV